MTRPVSKLVRKILIHQELWLWWIGVTCTIRTWTFFFSETTGHIWKYFTEVFLRWLSPKNCSRKFETWFCWMGASCTVWTWRNLKLFFSVTASQILRFWNNFIEVFIWWLFSKSHCHCNESFWRNKILWTNLSKKLFFSVTASQILTFWNRNIPLVTLFKNCLQNLD